MREVLVTNAFTLFDHLPPFITLPVIRSTSCIILHPLLTAHTRTLRSKGVITLDEFQDALAQDVAMSICLGLPRAFHESKDDPTTRTLLVETFKSIAGTFASAAGASSNRSSPVSAASLAGQQGVFGSPSSPKGAKGAGELSINSVQFTKYVL